MYLEISKIWKQVKQQKVKMIKWITMVKSLFNFEIVFLFNHSDEDDPAAAKLQSKKEKLKSTFDAEYDQSKEPDSTYLDDLQKEVDMQTKVLLNSSFNHFNKSLLVKSIGI
jgi:uncharacterized protein YpmS